MVPALDLNSVKRIQPTCHPVFDLNGGINVHLIPENGMAGLASSGEHRHSESLLQYSHF
jgi:hypothetical protein